MGILRTRDTILRRHAEDAGFLWARRQDVLRGARLKHAERARLDERLEANVDALRIAGEAGWAACAEVFEEWPEPGALFAAATLAFGECSDLRLDWIRARAGTDSPTRQAVHSALGWNPPDALGARLTRWDASGDAWLRSAAVTARTVHRAPPGSFLARALLDPEREVRAAGAKAAFELGGAACGAVRELLADGDAAVRFQAARAMVRSGYGADAAKEALLGFVAEDASYSRRAADCLVRASRREGRALFERWSAEPASHRMAVLAAEALGDADAVPWLITRMDDDDLARAAGDAFAAITGVDLVECSLSRPRAAYVRGDPTDDPDDAAVALDSEYALPFPSRVAVASWWRANADRFVCGTRHLAGVPTAFGSTLDPAHVVELRRLARTGRPRHQTMAALDLAFHDAALPTLETHAPATRAHGLPGWGGWSVPSGSIAQVRPQRAVSGGDR